jgi:hypothetical protein
MSTRNKILGLIFLVAVLAFALFVAKRLLFQTGPKRGGVTALPPRTSSPVTTPALPKPSAAVPGSEGSGSRRGEGAIRCAERLCDSN